MSTLMHNFCGKMLNVTKHQALFRLTAGRESPEDALAASSRHGSRHTTTERLRLYAAVAAVAEQATSKIRGQ